MISSLIPDDFNKYPQNKAASSPPQSKKYANFATVSVFFFKAAIIAMVSSVQYEHWVSINRIDIE
jgi:hypothetical protein